MWILKVSSKGSAIQVNYIVSSHGTCEKISYFFQLWTIIRTGITCNKSLIICATQLEGGLLLKMFKYFEVILNVFEFPHVSKIVES